MTKISFDKNRLSYTTGLNQTKSFQIINQQKHSKIHLEQLSTPCVKNRITSDELGHKYNSKVHTTFPETDIVYTKMILSCGDSHATTHNIFRTIAQQISTSQVAQVFSYICPSITFKYK